MGMNRRTFLGSVLALPLLWKVPPKPGIPLRLKFYNGTLAGSPDTLGALRRDRGWLLLTDKGWQVIAAECSGWPYGRGVSKPWNSQSTATGP